MDQVATAIYVKCIKNNDFSDGDVIVLDCGHFDSVLGTDDFSINTTQLAIDLFNLAEKERRRGVKFNFAVLIDDVGMQCSEDAMMCINKEMVPTVSRTSVPDEIISMIKDTVGFRHDRVKLFSEKTARNRGIQFFRKLLPAIKTNHYSAFVTEDTDTIPQLFCVLPNGQKVLMADMTTASQWSGHCPLLMGMHYRDVATWAQGRFSTVSRVHIIDFSLNQDKGKVNAGAEVALGVSREKSLLRSVANICFTDEDLDLYTIDRHVMQESV